MRPSKRRHLHDEIPRQRRHGPAHPHANFAFPTIAKFANYGVVSEDGKSITVDYNASNHYEISLDAEWRIQSLLHESTTYVTAYGDAESFKFLGFEA